MTNAALIARINAILAIPQRYGDSLQTLGEVVNSLENLLSAVKIDGVGVAKPLPYYHVPTREEWLNESIASRINARMEL